MTTGRVWAYADHVDTDAIIPACYLLTSDPAQLASHCLEGLDSTFAREVRPGDIIVAGENFGCGSSREHAPQALMRSGFRAFIGESFAEIFAGNCTALGLPYALLDADDLQHIFEGQWLKVQPIGRIVVG